MARDGRPDDTCGPLIETVIAPLYGAYASFMKAREKARHPRSRSDRAQDRRRRERPHRRRREARALRQPSADRGIHDRRQRSCGGDHGRLELSHRLPASTKPPDPERVFMLRESLQTLNIKIPPRRVTENPATSNRVITTVRGTPQEHMINSLVSAHAIAGGLQPGEQGAIFGLALRQYVHFHVHQSGVIRTCSSIAA